MPATADTRAQPGFAHHARVYVMETRAQCLTVARTPAFTIPTLAFPLMFYLFFGVVMAFTPTTPTYLLATYGVFGIIPPSLFGFGVGLATERESGALLLKQTTPMPVGAYLFARVAMALLFGAAVVLELFVLGASAGGLALYRWQWFALAGVVLAGVIPFCALGLAIGAWVRAQAAVAIVNLVYLPMAFLSGLWVPVWVFPPALQDLAVVFPAYHVAQLALKVISLDEGQPVTLHLAVLGACTVAFLIVASFGFRRVSER